MAEAVASHDHILRVCSIPESERRRQLDDLEVLVERLIERTGKLEKELRDVKGERDRLKEENERLRSE